ncbi:MAG: AbrB/MazE/SpoVT family DNA-binding domain-containing protein [Microcystaceae cyanobacterium]
MLLKVQKQDNQLNIVIPQEIAMEMNLEEGDSLFITKTPSGYEISAHDPNFENKIEIARRGMKKYHNTLIELAK